jgi:flagellum-specific peptidoglycan hydrolase FlgJ
MKTLFELKNVEFTLTEKLNMQNPSYYVRKAFQMYDCGLISMTEYVDIIIKINDYSHMKEEAESTMARVYDLEETLDSILK